MIIRKVSKNKKTGGPHSKPKSNISPIAAHQYFESLKDDDFKIDVVRKTPKEKPKYQVHIVRVWTWMAPSCRGKGQDDAKERALIIRKGINAKKLHLLSIH